MKKNLRIVSAAAAALLAVAPVAATAMPVNAATTDYTNISLGGQTVTNTQNQVDVTPSIVLNGNVKENNQIVSKASLNGSVSATFGGKSYTANLTGDNQNNVKIDGTVAKDALANVEAGKSYTVTIEKVGFNFGSENKGKKITIASSNENVTFGSSNAKTAEVTLDQNGTAKDLTVNIKVNAFNATNTNGVAFYNVATGTQATTGNAMVLANTQGQLNTAALLPAIVSNYVAVQRVNSTSLNGNGTYNFADFKHVTNIDFATAIKDQLKAQNIDVDAQGFFKAPHTFTVKVKATSDINGKTAELPVTVTVANVAKATEPSVAKDVMHAAYFYDKDGKRVGSDKAATYSSLNLVTENNELKKFTISGKTYYKVANEDKYVAAGNITGTSRTLKHNAYVYATSKKRVAAKTTYKKGQSVTTYGSAVKLKNGKAYYRVGKTEYVKKANF